MIQISDAYSNLTGKLENWINTLIAMLPNFVSALLVIVIFYLLARLVRRLISRTLARFSANLAVNNLIVALLFIFIFLAGIFIALGILNLDKTVTSLLAGVGIAGLVIGFAFKDIAANFLAGIYMAVKSPVNVGDMIEYDDVYGVVKDIGLRATVITTLQGQDVTIPNHLIMDNKYTHYTLNGNRRIDLKAGISYGDDLEKSEKVAIEAIKQIDFLKANTPVDLYYTEFGESSINFVIRYWVNFSKETDYLKALSQGIKNIKKAFNENGITITFPIRTLDFGIKGGKTLADMLSELDQGISKK